MKCPVCGTDNKSTYANCFRCGARLTPAQPPPASPSGQIWNADPKRGGRPQRDRVILDDEVEQVYANPELINKGVELPYNAEKLSGYETGDEIDVVLPRTRQKPPKRQRRVKVKWGRFITMSALALLVLAGAGWGIFRLVNHAIDQYAQRISSQQALAEAQSLPVVEKLMVEGRQWHKITFFGEDGQVVMLENPQRTQTIKDGRAEFMLDDEGFIPTSLDTAESTVTVELNAFIFDTDGQETLVRVEPYKIDVPLSRLKLIDPQDVSVSTDANRISIKIKVTPGSRVIIGTTNVSDRIDSQGYVSATVPVSPIGINNVPITVETPLHRTNFFTLEVNRPVMAVPINLSEDIKTETSDGAITIEGGTTPGATITTTAALEGELQSNAEDGTFRMTVKLERYGWNEISITSTLPDGQSSTLTQLVRHNADRDSYSRKAQVLDYDYLSTSAHAMLGRIFVFEGKVIREIDDETGSYFLFDAGQNNELKYMVIENDTSGTLKEGDYYRLFADVAGTYEDYPLLTARFKYDRDNPSATATPAPTDDGGDNP